MIVCLLGVYINISRLLKFVCLLTVLAIIQSKVVLFAHAVPGVKINVQLSPNHTLATDFTNYSNFIAQNITPTCTAEVIDETLPYFSLPYRIFAGALVVPITVCAISGNILVIYVIKHYRALRITGNIFLASLAVADVGVSTLAMTFYGLQLIQGRWILGAFMCRLWFSCDVLFSTASIMHLACIALDRYLSIVRPFDHERQASERRRYCMMAACWIGSALLSFIPIFTGIYTTREQRRKINCLNSVRGRCIFAVNQAYALVSSSFSFWVPGAIMIIIYVMLIRIADKKEKEAYRFMGSVVPRPRPSQVPQYCSRRRSSDDQTFTETTSPRRLSHRTQRLGATTANGSYNNYRRSGNHESFDTLMERQQSVDLPGNINDPRNSKLKHLRRERRAVKTLGAIMVAFLICWLPFFVRYSACEPDRCKWTFMPIIEDIVFWVGYFNSMINPFLYAFHNKDFRVAFEKTLRKYFVCCRERRASNASALRITPETPSGELHRTGSRRINIRNTRNQNTSRTSLNERRLANINGRRFTDANEQTFTNTNEQRLINTSRIPQENNGLEQSNGNLTDGDNSTSSKHDSIL